MIALCGLILCAFPMLLIACLIRSTSRGPVLIRQQRVGRHGQLFHLIKFRSMAETQQPGSDLTIGADSRVTSLGVSLRRFKLDELPQLYNVLRGDMSLVGPRPKLPRFAEIPNMPYRPGITGLASIAFRSEDQMLSIIPPEIVEPFYQAQIKPLKANLDICYMCSATPASDARVIAATALSCLAPAMAHILLGPASRSSASIRGSEFGPSPSIQEESLEA